MGKAAMCIRMLQILNTGRVYKVSELAELLDTNPRNIIEYKKELDEVSLDFGGGFYVDPISGRYGGYRLNGNAVIPALKLTAEEKAVLLESFNYAMTKKDFVKKDVLTSAFSKIASSIEIYDKENKLLVVDKYQLQMGEPEIGERYKFIEKAIKVKKTISMVYNSLKHGEVEHKVDPYTLFIYNNSWFFLGWDHEKGDVLYFKLNRIKSYEMTEKRFAVSKQYKPEQYFDETGMKYNGEYHHVVLIAKGTRARLLKERVYGKNQTIEELDDGSIKVSMEMQNDNTIVSFALSCGDEAKFLEPQWLVDAIKEKIEAMHNLYK